MEEREKTLKELILFKIDRTLAVLAIGVIGTVVALKLSNGDMVQVAIAALSGLTGYGVGRSVSK